MRIGLHYSFQAGPDESASAVIDDGLTDIAAADDAGFSSVVFAEHHFLDDGWLPRPMMLAAAAAAVTRRMRIGTDIVILALHHPVAVAEEAAVLDVMSGGAPSWVSAWDGSSGSSPVSECRTRGGRRSTRSRSMSCAGFSAVSSWTTRATTASAAPGSARFP